MIGEILVITKGMVTLTPSPISIAPLTSINYPNKIHTDKLLENPFFAIEQTRETIIPALQKLDNRTPDKFIAVSWYPGGNSMSIKWTTTISYIKESDCAEKSQNE